MNKKYIYFISCANVAADMVRKNNNAMWQRVRMPRVTHAVSVRVSMYTILKYSCIRLIFCQVGLFVCFHMRM